MIQGYTVLHMVMVYPSRRTLLGVVQRCILTIPFRAVCHNCETWYATVFITYSTAWIRQRNLFQSLHLLLQFRSKLLLPLRSYFDDALNWSYHWTLTRCNRWIFNFGLSTRWKQQIARWNQKQEITKKWISTNLRVMALALRFLNEAIFSGFAAAMLLELKNGVSVASHGYYLTHQIFTKLLI